MVAFGTPSVEEKVNVVLEAAMGPQNEENAVSALSTFTVDLRLPASDTGGGQHEKLRTYRKPMRATKA